MYISWLGHSCFKIEAKANGESVTIVVDPYEDSVGLKLPRVKADIVLVTHDHFDHNAVESLKGEPTVIRGAGEYEVKKVVVYGVPTYHDAAKGTERGINTCYRIDVEDLSIVHLGDLGHPLVNDQLELLEGADILMVPVGGTYSLDAKQAGQVVSQIEPRIVIPMHYAMPGLKFELDPVDKFLKEMGAQKAEVMDKFKITKKELMTEGTKVIVLKAE